MSDYKNLLLAVDEHVAVLTLNRPNVLNALTAELNKELEHALDTLGEDKKIRALILTGGAKAFAAGGDIQDMKGATPESIYAMAANNIRIYDKLEQFRAPTIAAVNGPCLGGGCELAMCCDFRVAGEGAKFGQPEIMLGILPGAGGTQRLPRLVGLEYAKRMIYLGKPIKAEEALRVGLVGQVVPDDQVMDTAVTLAKQMSAMAGFAMSLAKEAINTGWSSGRSEGQAREHHSFSLVFSTADQAEGFNAFIEKRPAKFNCQ